MKKFLSTLLLFGVFTIVIYALLVFVTGGYAPDFMKKNLSYKIGSGGHTYTRLKEADSVKNVDVLFLGSSHCYRGYDPRIFSTYGLRIFALGSSAQTPVQTEFLVNRYLAKFNPKVVVFDVYPVLFGNDGTESTLDMLSNTRIDAKMGEMIFKNNSDIRVYNTFIYALGRQAFNLNQHYKEKKLKGTDLYIPGGYDESQSKKYKPTKVAEEKYSFSQMQLDAFSRILENLKRKNITCIIVQAPVPEAAYKSHSNNGEFDSLMQTKGKYYNFNKRLTLSTDYFIDNSHLNQPGVNIYNQDLIGVLSNELNRIFPEKNGDELKKDTVLHN